MEVALSSCEKSNAHEDLLLAVETSLGVGGGLSVVAESSSGSSGRLPRRGEKGVSASSVGVGVSCVVANVMLNSLGDGPVEVVEFELCDNRRTMVRGLCCWQWHSGVFP
ncbi:hypothetical protein MRX96_042218 [Rhipicephalus microplus]